MKQVDERRGSAASRGYTVQWQHTRKVYLSLNPLCNECLKQNRLTTATTVHHIKEIRQGGEIHNPDNLMSLCRECHEKLHKRFKQKV
jgi:5-methylcytosine-specific restriction protein A